MGKWRETPPSGIEATRALLDQLMGANRNNDRPDAEVKDFTDDRVCKFYLCGLCPHDIFTKDIGRCSKMHSDQLKKEYEDKRATGKSYGYEKDLEDELKAYVNDIEKKIQKAQKRLEESGEGAGSSVNLENHDEVLKLQAKIQELVQEVEIYAETGDIDRAQELTDEIEKMKVEKAQLQAKLMAESNVSNPTEPNQLINVSQKLRVCDVCGALLSIFDSDQRLADHFGGKQHMGYRQVRDKLKEIQEMREKERINQLNNFKIRSSSPSIDKKKDNRRQSRSRSRSSSRRSSRYSRKRRDSRSRSRSSSRRRRNRSDSRRHRHHRKSRSESKDKRQRHESETKT